jgi:uncharacterized protein YprB with RNaseH-like and TPR domain
MDLRRKLARLRDAAAPPTADAPPVAEPAVAAEPAPDDLRARLKAVAARTKRKPAPAAPAAPVAPCAWPFTAHADNDGAVTHRALRTYDDDARHGRVALRRALDVAGSHAATLALDPALAGFEAGRALFLDTETTGLSGGTGTLAFLVGMAWFEGATLHLEQLLLADVEHEAPMLACVAARIAAAGALVTYNGRTFDLPLLRSRFVMARVAPPVEPPHLDLLHVARRIYGARVERCNLTTLERDVLGFERVGDIDGADIPERYQRFLREGDAARESIVPVVEHNAWDLAALAALTGELGARLARTEAEGRFEANDLVGLARTTQRAGDADLAVLLATEAAAMGAARGESRVARDAHVLAARIHKRTRDPEAMRARLIDALAHAPDDPAVHLELAKSYERTAPDAARALAHALRAADAEEPELHARRIARLRRKVKLRKAEQLRLPGV